MKIKNKNIKKTLPIYLFLYLALFFFIQTTAAKSVEILPDFIKNQEHSEILSNSWKVISAIKKVYGKGGLDMEKAAYSAAAVIIADMVRKKIDDDYWAKHGAGPYFVRGYGSKLFIHAAVWGSQKTGSFDQINQRDPYMFFNPNSGPIPQAWNFTQFVSNKCNGRSACDISTNYKDFDYDPSPGQDKILSVKFGCHEPGQPVLVSSVRWDPENNYGQNMHIECK